jgi:putative FmdB family regulatory protein
MPIYEFHCAGCGRDSEILVRSSQWKGTRCPHCGSARIEKKLSVFASNAGGAEPSPACGLNASSCCRCSGRGPHRH